MSRRHFALLKHTWLRMLLFATLPLACAVGVKPDFEDGAIDPSGNAGGTGGGGTGTGTGHSSGGSLPFAGSTSGGTAPKAGAPSGGAGGSGGSASPFGGTSSSGGKGGGGAAGAPAGGATGTAGTAGSAGASGAGGAGGAGMGTCDCPGKILMWTDNTTLTWGPGACLDVQGKTYLYIGTKAQTYANKDCNPTKQLTWCTDAGNDYKFMACN